MIQDARSTKAAGEITRKEMKGPDHFQVAATNAAEWAAKNRQVVYGVLGGAVVLLVAVVVVQGAMKSTRDRAGGMLFRVLEDVDGVVSTVPLPGVDRPIFKSEQDQQKAVVAGADKLRQAEAGSRAAVTANVVAGEAQLRLKEWDAALASFNTYLAAAPQDDSIRFAGLDGVARALEGKGDLEGAAKAWERAGAEAPFFKERAVLERARVLAAAQKVEEARKLLQAFPEEFKESALKGEAQERLVALGGK